jgi:hypothetical protein
MQIESATLLLHNFPRLSRKFFSLFKERGNIDNQKQKRSRNRATDNERHPLTDFSIGAVGQRYCLLSISIVPTVAVSLPSSLLMTTSM